MRGTAPARPTATAAATARVPACRRAATTRAVTKARARVRSVALLSCHLAPRLLPPASTDEKARAPPTPGAATEWPAAVRPSARQHAEELAVCNDGEVASVAATQIQKRT